MDYHVLFPTTPEHKSANTRCQTLQQNTNPKHREYRIRANVGLAEPRPLQITIYGKSWLPNLIAAIVTESAHRVGCRSLILDRDTAPKLR